METSDVPNGFPAGALPTRRAKHDMQWRNPLAKWLLHFASSQRNIDWVAIWFGGTVSVLALAWAVVVLVMRIFW